MAKKLAGMKAGKNDVSVVVLTKEDSGDYTLEEEISMSLQHGERAAAYHTLYNQLSDYLRQHDVECVCVKGSAVSLRGVTLAHFEGAEVRGIVQAAGIEAGAQVKMMIKATASRTFGNRKVDEYVKDNSYWDSIGLGALKKGMREAAFAAVFLSRD